MYIVVKGIYMRYCDNFLSTRAIAALGAREPALPRGEPDGVEPATVANSSEEEAEGGFSTRRYPYS
jgi:hypothetical protein